ncbi:MAG: glycosyltransferase [bacterium]|nr:glycosyltransferase [bacterium]
MLISVIVATKNEEKNIENCLKSIKSQTYPQKKTEIVVVDNNSDDETKNVAEKYADFVFNCGPERSTQRNFGVNKSKGDWFIYLDADMMLSENVIRECAEKVKNNSELVALYIPEIITGRSFWSKVRNFERSFYNGTVIDGTRFISKEAFEKVQGFDEKLYAFEDWDLDNKLKGTGKFDIIKSPIFHNENDFCLKKYLSKKKCYLGSFEEYRKKWGEKNQNIRKQFGFWYRFSGVFMENGKWKKIAAHPVLSLGIFFLRFLVGFNFLMK